MKRFLLLGALVGGLSFVAGHAAAQTGTVRGKVKDPAGEPIVDAAVVMEYLGGVSQKYETKTSKKGDFIQVGMRTGQYRITVSAEGYQGSYIEYRIRIGPPTQLPEFVLETKAAAQQARAEETMAQVKGAFDVAIALTGEEKWDEATAAFKALLEENPSVPEAHYNLGFIASQRKDWAAAEEAYLKAIELRPDYGEAYVALSGVYSATGRPEEAMAALNKAAVDNEGNAQVQFNLGIQHFNNNQFPEARVAFDKCVAASPEHADAHFYLGNVLVNLGEFAGAIENLEKYVSLKPDNAQNLAAAEQMITGLRPYVK